MTQTRDQQQEMAELHALLGCGTCRWCDRESYEAHGACCAMPEGHRPQITDDRTCLSHQEEK